MQVPSNPNNEKNQVPKYGGLHVKLWKISAGPLISFSRFIERKVIDIVSILIMHKLAVDTQKFDMNKLSTWNVFIFIVMWFVMYNVESKLIGYF